MSSSGAATAAIQLIGRTTNFYGHTLWEIVGNLRNFGVGRMIIRRTFQRYSEPCYYRILKVTACKEPEEEREIRKVKVLVEKTWRGVTCPDPVLLYSCSYKPDFELVPKADESQYLKNTNKISEKLLPQHIDFPPLLREYLREETGQAEPFMKVHLKKKDNKYVRIAKQDEKPTIDVSMALHKPASPKLYDGLL